MGVPQSSSISYHFNGIFRNKPFLDIPISGNPHMLIQPDFWLVTLLFESQPSWQNIEADSPVGLAVFHTFQTYAKRLVSNICHDRFPNTSCIGAASFEVAKLTQHI